MRSQTCDWALKIVLILALLIFTNGNAFGQKKGGTLVFVVPDEPPSFDGHRETTFALIHPVAPHYSVLVRVDPQDPGSGKIVCDLCTGWKVSADRKTYTFDIRRGVTFHDGEALTAKDIVASYHKIINPPKGVLSPRKAFYSMVGSVSAPNSDTVVFQLKFDSPAFLPALANPFNFIYSAKRLSSDIHWYEKNVLGSGPFRLKSRAPGANWIGIRYEKYHHQGLPYLDGFEAIIAKRESLRVQAVRGGRAMIEFRGFPPSARDDLKRTLGNQITVQENTWNCSIFVVPNPYKKPFDDPRVRRALSLAIDRWGGSNYLSRITIVKTVGGIVFPDHPLAPTTEELQKFEGFGRDLEANRTKSRQLLKEADVPEGYKFKLHNRDVDQPYKVVGTWLVDQWLQVGLDVEQWVQPTDSYFKVLRSGKGSTKPPEFDVTLDYNCQAVVDPTLDVAKVISYDKSPSNHGSYIDRELDTIYETQLREPDQAKQKILLMQLMQRNVEQAWQIPTLWWHRIIPHNTRLKGWKISPSHYLNQDLSFLWLD